MNTVLTLALLTAATFSSPLSQDPPIPADTEVHTTSSGLQYSVLAPGAEDGRHPGLTDLVRVHYTGWLEDGTVFDSSRKKDQPAAFRLGQVIRGWNEGLKLMTVGSRFKFKIPPDLAYGEPGTRGIPPNSTLTFEVELLEFEEGPGVPDFIALDPAQSKITESGLKVQVLEDGTGKVPAADQRRFLRYALWNLEGEILDCSTIRGQALRGTAADIPIPFLKEVIGMLRPGARYLLEVPPELCFGDQAKPGLPAGSTSIWQVQGEPLRPAVAEDQWITTKSGLRYQPVHKLAEDATGATPKMGEKVAVHYSGWLKDGSLFDSSIAGGPVTFRLGAVVPGWNEGLQLMKEGETFLLSIPPVLAYGARGKAPVIPPNATLLFIVELIKVN